MAASTSKCASPQVIYRQNGVVKRTVTTSADRTFYFDSSLYDKGFKFNNVHFGACAPKGVQLAYAAKQILLGDDAAGNRRTATSMDGGYAVSESYNYAPEDNTTYAKFDSYKESKVAGSSGYFQPGATTTSYARSKSP